MPSVSLKFEYRHEKTMYGKRTGTIVADVGESEARAESVDELKQEIAKVIHGNSKTPEVEAVSLGGELRVAVTHGGLCRTYRQDCEADGIQNLRQLSSSFHTIEEETRYMLSDVAQLYWSDRIHDGEETQEYLEKFVLLPEQIPDFRSWLKFQRQHSQKQQSAQDF